MANAFGGLLACLGASVLFGSTLVPVRKHNPGNGLYVQFVQAVAIWIVGLIVYALEGFPKFMPLAMLGGVCWAIGNVTAVPIVGQLGLGTSILLWGTTNCVTGWAVGRFGLFGTKAHPPTLPWVSYAGLGLVLIGGALFSQIKPSESEQNEEQNSGQSNEGRGGPTEDDALLGDVTTPRQQNVVEIAGGQQEDGQEPVILPSSLPHRSRRLIAVVAALGAGVLYGINFSPVIYMQDNPDQFPGAPASGLPYVFAHYSGILLAATAILAIYIVWTGNRPEVWRGFSTTHGERQISPPVTGPSLLAGLMWATAQSLWFVANDALSQAVTFPIVAMTPGAIAALWSVFYFREIRGAQNLRLLSVAIGLTFLGTILVGVSK